MSSTYQHSILAQCKEPRGGIFVACLEEYVHNIVTVGPVSTREGPPAIQRVTGALPPQQCG